MPINLDTCITGIFVPGNIGASSGLTPVQPVVPTLVVDVTPPQFVSADNETIEENVPLAFTVEADEVVTFTIAGGADAAMFEFDGANPATSITLRFAGDATKDFEAPDDADTDNDYEVSINIRDATGNTNAQAITITVTDVVIEGDAILTEDGGAVLLEDGDEMLVEG